MCSMPGPDPPSPVPDLTAAATYFALYCFASPRLAPTMNRTVATCAHQLTRTCGSIYSMFGVPVAYARVE